MRLSSILLWPLRDGGPVRRERRNPEPLEIRTDLGQPCWIHCVDPASALGTYGDQTGVLEHLRGCEKAGRPEGASFASSATDRGPPPSVSKIDRRVGSASASSTW